MDILWLVAQLKLDYTNEGLVGVPKVTIEDIVA